MNTSSLGGGEANADVASPAQRPLRQRIALAVLAAAAISAAVGGLWTLAGLPGGPGPVFGVAFAALMLFVGTGTAANAAVRRSARRKIDARFPTGDYLRAADMALNFGLTSRGKLQVRGNGALVLTKDALLFLPLVGIELAIPRADIRGTSIVRSHLGKRVGRRLLKVEFADDSVAFFLEDPTSWAESLAPATSSAPLTT